MLKKKFQDLLFQYTSRIRNTIYHWRTAEWDVIRSYQSNLNGSKWLPFVPLLFASWKHGASFADYYRYKFYQKDTNLRRTYITTSLRHEITRQLNDPSACSILRDKVLFAEYYADVLGRSVWTWDQLLSNPPHEKPPRLVIKNRLGQQGAGMLFPADFATWRSAWNWIGEHLETPQNHVFESWIHQHAELSNLYADSVNTLRIVTCLQDDQVHIWGIIQRIGVNSGIDNMSQGNLGAWVSSDGVIKQPAYKKDPLFYPCSHHPVSGKRFIGFKIPYFNEVIDLAIESATRIPKVRSVGWDIAIGTTGPCLLEGNDNWHAQSLQITCGEGLRHLSEPVCNMKLVYD